MKPYFTLGPHFSIPSYNFFIAVGIALAMLLLQYNKTFKHLPSHSQHKVHTALLLSIITGFLGAYIFDAYTQHRTLFNSMQYGLTLLGGVLVGFVVIITFLLINKITVLPVLNMLTPSFALAHCFGRLGCFFAGCCFGLPTHSPLGVIFPIHSLAYQHYHALVPVHPTQLYEAAFAIILFAVIYFRRVRNPFYLYFAAYSIFRFCIEYIRADDRGNILGQTLLSPSQCISLIIFICCSVLYTRATYRHPRIA